MNDKCNEIDVATNTSTL